VESDLPTYYWPTRFGSAQLLSDYTYFFKSAERVIFDSACESFLSDQVDVSHREKLHDLAFSRLLSIRQSIGQFMSAYSKERIVDGLKEVSLSCNASFRSEGRALMDWVASSLTDCYEPLEDASGRLKFEQVEMAGAEAMLRMSFIYANSSYLTFDIDLEKGETHVEADLGNGKQSMTTGVRLLETQAALAEALFFA